MERYGFLRKLIPDEFQARVDDDGCEPADLLPLRERFEREGERMGDDELRAFYRELMSVEPRGPVRDEPSELAAIQAARPPGPRELGFTGDTAELRERILGGLLGRAAGCILGKPVESWSRHQIEVYLKEFGEEDVVDYFPYAAEGERELPAYILPARAGACRGHIRFVLRDDDIDYTVMGLHVLSTYGFDFTTNDVAAAWLRQLPYGRIYTAEKAAYRNLLRGVTPPDTAVYYNPYRQWIGAQIRADAFGYTSPGRPERAAALAWRDAALSHVKNGIYGEMWVAAALAAAFCLDDVRDVIAAATAEIPRESRFAEMVADVLRWSEEHADWKSCWERIKEKYGRLNPTHTLNNAALVVLALLYGEKDFSRTIGIAVQGGWDTDCNGATAGSILGVMLGAAGVPARWTRPFNGTVRTLLPDYNPTTFDELAELACSLATQACAG